MTMKEQLAELRKELEELKPRIAEEDAEAIDRAKSILETEIPELEAKMEKAAQVSELMGRLGEPAKSEPAKAKTLGEFCAKSFAGKYKKGERFSANAEFKTDPTVISGAPTLYDYDKRPVNLMTQPTIADLFGRETISGNALTYWVMSDLNGGVGTVAEGGKKPMVDFTWTAKTVALTKIAGYIKETDEILEDAPWLASACEERLMNKFYLAEEAQLLNGNGSAPNMTGLLNTSGIGEVEYESTLSADDIFKAMMKVKADSNLDADAIVINPTDYQALRLAKDSNNQYYGGGYFYGEYGNGSMGSIPALWGLKTVISTAVTAGTVIVGAFKQGASIISKRGISIDATNTNEDDFIYNRVTIRAEKREALAVRIPQAFVVVAKNS